MRERIGEILRLVRDVGWLLERFDVASYPPNNSYLNQVIKTIADEIEGLKNPFDGTHDAPGGAGFEICREKMLEILK
jgi:hypothetical protein